MIIWSLVRLAEHQLYVGILAVTYFSVLRAQKFQTRGKRSFHLVRTCKLSTGILNTLWSLAVRLHPQLFCIKIDRSKPFLRYCILFVWLCYKLAFRMFQIIDLERKKLFEIWDTDNVACSWRSRYCFNNFAQIWTNNILYILLFENIRINKCAYIFLKVFESKALDTSAADTVPLRLESFNLICLIHLIFVYQEESNLNWDQEAKVLLFFYDLPAEACVFGVARWSSGKLGYGRLSTRHGLATLCSCYATHTFRCSASVPSTEQVP